MNRLCALILIILITLSGLLMIESTSAQTIPKPSVPEFILKYVNNSYVIPETTTYSTNPYTGEQKAVTSGGYLLKNTTIEMVVKSQSFPSSVNDTSLNVYYNVRAKGYYEPNWSNLNLPEYAENSITKYWLDYLPSQQNSEYTIISISANTYPVGGTVEFQVRAILGGDFPTENNYPYSGYGVSNFVYESSYWSPTQTITIAEESSVPNPSPTQSYTSVSSSPSPIGTINTGPHTEPFPIETVLLVFSILTVVVIVSLLLYIGHLKRSTAKPDNSAV